MLENGMLAGAAQWHDDRAEMARAQAMLAQTLTAMLIDAVRRGHNPPLLRGGTHYATTAAEGLFELYGVEQDVLYRACHQAAVGNKDGAYAALIQFIDVAADRFGTNAAERLLAEEG